MSRTLLWRAVLCAAIGLALPAWAKDAAVRCANLIYAGTQTSRCFSDEFLSAVQRESTIATERRFKSVKLDSEELFAFPFVVMTGEKEFYLSAKERENLKKYLTRGGFLLASAGCSSKEWDRSFRREMRQVLSERKLTRIDMDHAVFKTVKTIKELKLSHGGSDPYLEGIENDGKTVVIYSSQGLNDTAHTVGCCCCGGNEIVNSMEVNVNILVYALTH
ncbi:MAG: DUF4159 domain-containing protein [bacterium]